MAGWFLHEKKMRRPNTRLLPLCILLLAVGCSSNRKSAEYSEVTGKVLYQGKGLPGGRVTFVSSDGFSGSANIDENGEYKISAPIGEVKISVDNRMLAGGTSTRKGPGAPDTTKQILKRPGSEEPQKMKGQYVSIPEKYASPDQSGLKYKVVKGSQTHDIPIE